MWIATTSGYYSAVAHRDIPDHVMVRARSHQDLLNLVEIADSHRIALTVDDIVETLTDADYPYRITMSIGWWASLLEAFADAIDYDNFKDAVHRTNHERAHTYTRVWADLRRIESEPRALAPRKAAR